MTRNLLCVSVVWNHRDRLGLLLRSLDEQTRRPDGIVVIDAASRDGTAAWVAQNHPYVSVLRLFQRHGLTHAWRQAVRFALQRVAPEDRERTWILFVAPEVMLANDACEQLLQEVGRLPDAGAIGPVVLQAWKHEREDEAFQEVEPTQQVAALGIQLRRTFTWQYGHAGQGFTPALLPEAKSVLALPGLAAAYRADDVCHALEEDGLWNSEFEETEALFMDLAMRLRAHGRASYLSPLALAWRVDYRGALVGREKWTLDARHERDRQRLAQLGANGGLWWRTLPWRYAQWCLGLGTRLLARQASSTPTASSGQKPIPWQAVATLWPLLKTG